MNNTAKRFKNQLALKGAFRDEKYCYLLYCIIFSVCCRWYAVQTLIQALPMWLIYRILQHVRLQLKGKHRIHSQNFYIHKKKAPFHKRCICWLHLFALAYELYPQPSVNFRRCMSIKESITYKIRMRYTNPYAHLYY